MKVKVLKCSKPTYWYANKIGQEFEVSQFTNDDHYSLINTPLHCLDKKDCEIVKSKFEQKIDDLNSFMKGCSIKTKPITLPVKMIKIEKNIPIPAKRDKRDRKSKFNAELYPIEKMEAGDSFLITELNGHKCFTAIYFSIGKYLKENYLEKEFLVRVIYQSVRVWRLH